MFPLAVEMIKFLVAITPAAIERGALEHAINRVFYPALRRGDLDFLRNRRLAVHMKDAGIRWLFSVRGSGIAVLPDTAVADVTISGELKDFAHLATHRVDPDTLFFQRRLVIEGEVALGLMVKNFLDALDPGELPWPMQSLIRVADQMIGPGQS
jgi:predicted lipid carrier protein YhbT